MSTILKIGNDGPSPESVKAWAEGLDQLLKTSYETRLEQKTIRSIIELFSKMQPIGPTHISNNVFRNEIAKSDTPPPKESDEG